MSFGGVLTCSIDLGPRGFGTAHFSISAVQDGVDLHRVMVHEEDDAQARDVIEDLGADELEKIAATVWDNWRKDHV